MKRGPASGLADSAVTASPATADSTATVYAPIRPPAADVRIGSGFPVPSPPRPASAPLKALPPALSRSPDCLLAGPQCSGGRPVSTMGRFGRFDSLLPFVALRHAVAPRCASSLTLRHTTRRPPRG